MADNRIIPINPDSDLNKIMNQAIQNLQTQGYTVHAQMHNPSNASMTVSKDKSGINDFIGFGVECRVNIALINAGQLSVTIDSEWTNKIIAIGIGVFASWLIVGVGLIITGIIGCVNQADLPAKIFAALNSSYGQIPFNNYQPPVNNYQPPVNNYQPPVNNYQPPVNNYQPPVNNYQPPVENYQPPVNNYQAPVNNYQAPVENYQAPVENYQAPVDQPSDNNF